jgi:transglutaminase-like putative cysteine protease
MWIAQLATGTPIHGDVTVKPHCVPFLMMLLGGSLSAEDKADAPRSRTFDFVYEATVSGLAPGQKARVWLPVPSNSAEQRIDIENMSLPVKGQWNRDKVYGNRILHFQAPADKDGKIGVRLSYRVTRREVRTGDLPEKFFKPAPEEKILRFLEADTKVPVGGRPLELLKGKQVPPRQLAAAKVFYDVVNEHMRYSKEGKGWGQGDAVWACDSKFGNCTDFHSLFISLARSHKIPSKFEIGFPLPVERGMGKVAGYHCWAWFLPDGKGWVPVDISEANRHPKLSRYYFGNLSEDRVAFSIGRDLELVPRQAGPPLNFFIYPYAEVGDRRWPSDQIKSAFTFQDR